MGTDQKHPSLHLGTNRARIHGGVVFLCVYLNPLPPLLLHQCFPLNIPLTKEQKSAFTISTYKVLPSSEPPKGNTACLPSHK